jgi:hypothetical protein
MSFLLAAFVLLVALFAGIFLDGNPDSERNTLRRPNRTMDLW